MAGMVSQKPWKVKGQGSNGYKSVAAPAHIPHYLRRFIVLLAPTPLHLATAPPSEQPQAHSLLQAIDV